ncbi:hypothetical protein KGQ55_01460 [Patescibacteria group bacterium]|nr:hypothetical protein [Patescibacteria group bacterium]
MVAASSSEARYYYRVFFIPATGFYLVLTIPFLFVWGALYAYSKRTRTEQWLLSVAGAIVGPLSEIIYVRDYWSPQSVLPLHFGFFVFMPEDLLFGFAVGGIAAVIYEAVFRLRQRKVRVHKRYASMLIVAFFFVVLELLLRLHWNSIYASAAAFVIVALPMFWWRSDLLWDAIGSGVGTAAVLFLCYAFVFGLTANIDALLREGWLLYGTTFDWRFLGIPITELTWAFTMGFLIGPLYEFLRDKKLVHA